MMFSKISLWGLWLLVFFFPANSVWGSERFSSFEEGPLPYTVQEIVQALNGKDAVISSNAWNFAISAPLKFQKEVILSIDKYEVSTPFQLLILSLMIKNPNNVNLTVASKLRESESENVRSLALSVLINNGKLMNDDLLRVILDGGTKEKLVAIGEIRKNIDNRILRVLAQMMRKDTKDVRLAIANQLIWYFGLDRDSFLGLTCAIEDVPVKPKNEYRSLFDGIDVPSLFRQICFEFNTEFLNSNRPPKIVFETGWPSEGYSHGSNARH